MTKTQIETRANVKLIRGWILDGSGPARFGYALLEPYKQRWLGRSLNDVATALGLI